MRKLSSKDFVTILDLTAEDLAAVLQTAREQKPLARQKGLAHSHAGRVLACIFHKPSLRTRVSFEVAMTQLGGSSLYITDKEIGLGTRESVDDVARVLERMVDGIMIRTFAHASVEKLAAAARRIPVINGLTDLHHPCQVLADVFTIQEQLGGIEGRRVAYIGDGNNMAHSWIDAAARFPFSLVVCSPQGYTPSQQVIERAQRGGRLDLTVLHDPHAAVAGAHVIYTDVWASMGQEDEAAARARAFAGYQVNADLLRRAQRDAIVLHCLPAHRGLEITDEVMDGPQSRVFDQSENRLHVQRAILAHLLP
jgi:ornithine carbamoyltransferase